MTKKKFRFNAVDAFIILVVIAALAVFAYVFVGGKDSDVVGGNEKVRLQYVIQTVDIKERYVDAIAVGDELYEADTDSFLGTVTDVSAAPAYFTGTNAKTGAQVISEVEGRKSLYITLDSEAEVKDGTNYVDVIPILVGGTCRFITPKLIAGANIVSVEVVD